VVAQKKYHRIDRRYWWKLNIQGRQNPTLNDKSSSSHCWLAKPLSPAACYGRVSMYENRTVATVMKGQSLHLFLAQLANSCRHESVPTRRKLRALVQNRQIFALACLRRELENVTPNKKLRNGRLLAIPASDWFPLAQRMNWIGQ
jgi:hypothetical protein